MPPQSQSGKPTRTVRAIVAHRSACCVFASLLLAQILLAARVPDDWQLQASAGPPPSVAAVRLASLDEPQLAGYATALYIQGFDAQAGALLALRSADFVAIRCWLELAFALDPHSGYPLMLAAFDYTEPARMQDEIVRPREPAAPALLDFVERGYRVDPATHWRWLAHASWVARFALHDDQRALAEARMLRDAPASAGIPRWARELDSFVLSRSDPLDARRALLGGFAAGTAKLDPREIERLAGRVEAMSVTKATNSNGFGMVVGRIPGSTQDHDGRKPR